LLHLDAEKYREDGKENPSKKIFDKVLPLFPPNFTIPTPPFKRQSIQELIFLVGPDTTTGIYRTVLFTSGQPTQTAYISRAQSQMI